MKESLKKVGIALNLTPLKSLKELHLLISVKASSVFVPVIPQYLSDNLSQLSLEGRSLTLS